MEIVLQSLIWVLLATGVGSFVVASVMMYRGRGANPAAVHSSAAVVERPPAARLKAQGRQPQLRVVVPKAPPPRPLHQSGNLHSPGFAEALDDDDEAPTELLSADQIADLLGPERVG